MISTFKTNPPRAFLFDYGGTLDTGALHWAHVLRQGYRHTAATVAPSLETLTEEQFREAYVFAERALARNPIIVPDDDFHALLVKKVRIEIERLLEQEAYKPANAAEVAEAVGSIAAWCDGFARSHAEKSRKVLEALRQDVPMVLVTNFYGNIRSVLRGYGLDHLFPCIVESATAGVRKPDPAIWLLGAEAAGYPPADCVAIGDAMGKDIVPARSVGMRTVWYKGQGWESKEEDESVPTVVITELEQLLKIF